MHVVTINTYTVLWTFIYFYSLLMMISNLLLLQQKGFSLLKCIQTYHIIPYTIPSKCSWCTLNYFGFGLVCFDFCFETGFI